MTKRVVVCNICGTEIPVEPSENEALLEQLREEARQEAKAGQDAAVKTAVDAALEKARVKFFQQETKAAQERAASEKAVDDLRHKLDMAEQEKRAAVQNAVAEAEAEKARLSAELHHSKEASEMALREKSAQAAGQISALEAKYMQEEARVKAAAADEIADRDKQIAALVEREKAAGAEKELAVKSVQEQMAAELQKKEVDLLRVKSDLEAQIREAKLQGTMQKDRYEAALRLKEEELQRVKDFKAKLSTKALGESLEQYCQNQFNRIRTTAFPGATFEKDNNAATGSKGDFIYRESHEGLEIISIMFEMKTESDETASKHKNEDFLKELDKDRREKMCEYAVLVSTLEADNDFYNAGIQDLSYRYPKMFVVRPTQFIAIICLLRNAALNSLEYQKELARIKAQQLDLTNFEANMDAFKDAFGRNYKLASDRLRAAVDGIDKSILALQKTKDNLLASENQLRLANDKAEDLSIRKLTKGAPSVAALLDGVKKAGKVLEGKAPEGTGTAEPVSNTHVPEKEKPEAETDSNIA